MKKALQCGAEIPIKGSLFSVEKYPLHYHQGVQLIYVKEGSILLRVSYGDYILEKGDLHIINIGDIHSIHGVLNENSILVVDLDILWFKNSFPDIERYVFISYKKSKSSTSKEQDMLVEMMEQTLELEKHIELDSKNIAQKLGKEMIELLCKEWQYFSISNQEKVFAKSTPYKMDHANYERINTIVGDIYASYNKKINLSAMAEKLHISKYYLSHIIKEGTGENYQTFVNMVRAEMSEILLLDTNKSITEIALECGFSNTKYYNDAFYKWFKVSPKEYRNIYSEKTIKVTEAIFEKFSSDNNVKEQDLKSKVESIDFNLKPIIYLPALKNIFLLLRDKKLLFGDFITRDFLEMLGDEVIYYSSEILATRDRTDLKLLTFPQENAQGFAKSTNQIKLEIRNMKEETKYNFTIIEISSSKSKSSSQQQYTDGKGTLRYNPQIDVGEFSFITIKQV